MDYSKYFRNYKKLTSEVGKTIGVIDYDLFEEFFEVLAEDMNIPEVLKVATGLMCTGGNRSSEVLKIKKEDMYYHNEALFGKSIILKKKHVVPYKAVIAIRLKELEHKKVNKDETIKLYQEVYELWLKTIKRNKNSIIKHEFGVNFNICLEMAIEASDDLRSQDIKRVMNSLKNTYDKNRDNLRLRYLPRRDFIVHGSIRPIIETKLKKISNTEKLVKVSRFQVLRLVKRYFGNNVTAHSMRHSFVSYLLFKCHKTTAEVAQITGMTEDNVKNYAKYKLVDELMGIYSNT